MALPVAAVVKPASLLNQPNGNLDPSTLVNVHPSGVLHKQAARAWNALVAEAKANDLPLTFTYGGMYRSYAAQVNLFRQRYVPFVQYKTTPTGTLVETRREWWDGKWWWLKNGVAGAARPGTSNHGWGLAVDTAFDTDPTDGLGPDDAAGITRHPKWLWFVANAPRFGFSWEDQSEPWHIRYVTGDNIPAAVINFENAVVAAPGFPPFDPDKQLWSLYPIANKPAVKLGDSGDLVKYLQGVLKYKAGQTGIGVIDGKFGPKTEAAVKIFQQFFGFTVDGWVGAQTWGMIDYVATH